MEDSRGSAFSSYVEQLRDDIYQANDEAVEQRNDSSSSYDDSLLGIQVDKDLLNKMQNAEDKEKKAKENDDEEEEKQDMKDDISSSSESEKYRFEHNSPDRV